LILGQDGTTLSGWYAGPESRALRVTGTFTDEGIIRLRTENGAIEFIGAHDWRADDDNKDPVRRLSITGGMAHGAVPDFGYVDAY
jgi:hypothetical protein